MKRFVFVTLLLLTTVNVISQNYYEQIRSARKIIDGYRVLELSSGDIISVEDHGAYEEDMTWNMLGTYIIKMNNKAEILDSLFIEYPKTLSNVLLMRNPYEENSNIIADFYDKDGDLYYKAFFFDDDLNIVDIRDVPFYVSLNRIRTPFVDNQGNLILCGDYDGKINFVKFDIYGNILCVNPTELSIDEYIWVWHPFFIHNTEQNTYGFVCGNRTYHPDVNMYSEDGSTTLFILDNDLNVIDEHIFNTIGGADPYGLTSNFNMLSREDNGLLLLASMILPSGKKTLQLTLFDSEFVDVKNKRFATTDNGLEGATSHSTPIVQLEDGSLYVIWMLPDGDVIKHYVTYLDKDLNVQWEVNFYQSAESGYTTFRDARLMENNNLVICGSTMNENYENYPITYIFENNTISVPEKTTKSFSIYPNPAKDVVKVSSTTDQPSEVKIYNILGMLVEEIEMNSEEIEINVSDYNSGVYFVEIDGEIVKLIKN